MRGRCFFLNVTFFFCSGGCGCGEEGRLSFGWMELVLCDTGMMPALCDRYSWVLEPLAVLGLLLGGQRVSLGFFITVLYL